MFSYYNQIKLKEINTEKSPNTLNLNNMLLYNPCFKGKISQEAKVIHRTK